MVRRHVIKPVGSPVTINPCGESESCDNTVVRTVTPLEAAVVSVCASSPSQIGGDPCGACGTSVTNTISDAYLAQFQSILSSRYVPYTGATQNVDLTPVALIVGTFSMPEGAAEGYVLTATASGIAEWQPPFSQALEALDATYLRLDSSNGPLTASLAILGTLTVNGFKMATGASAGYVFTSDANGNASWQAGGSSDQLVKVSATDTTANYLSSKIASTDGTIYVAVGGGSGTNQTLIVNVDLTAVSTALASGRTTVLPTSPPSPLETNYTYITSNASTRVVMTLPSAPLPGDMVTITGRGLAGWRIQQPNVTSIVHIGNINTSMGVGGYIESTSPRDSLVLLCVSQNGEWNAIGAVGSLEIF